MTAKFPRQDNSTFSQKVMIRQTALSALEEPPIVMETHGGRGKIWQAVYNHLPVGVVFEKDPVRATFLAHQRPTWAVYEADCEKALTGWAGAHLEVNLLDVDPFGDPWPVIRAFFHSERPRARQLVVVVNDGLGKTVQIGTAWQRKTLERIVQERGNDIWGEYLDVCRELMTEAVAPAGYAVRFFDGYHCGNDHNMTHYLAILLAK